MNYNFANLIIAIVLSVGIIFGWQYFFEKPRLERLSKEHEVYQEQVKKQKTQSLISYNTTILERFEAIDEGARVNIESDTLSGSISLKGLRFDDLTLMEYNQDLGDDTKKVELFSPSNTQKPYFAEVGWWSNSKAMDLPSSDTIWSADGDTISPDQPVTFSWKNTSGVLFQVEVGLDENFMFTISQKTINRSSRPISSQFYGLVNRLYDEKADRMVNILHQGFIGVVDGELKEFAYDKVKDNKRENFARGKVDWFGITDKFWLSAIIPDQNLRYSSNYNYAVKSGKDKFQADFVSGTELIEPGAEHVVTHRLFAGAKKVALLDKYEKQYNIALFDRAIDFGWLYILTKPIFNLMNFFYSFVGNFGISIMIVTVLIKLALFSLANKSYRSMKRMKALQPQMERLKELYAEDKARMNQEVMAMYKREKVNPLSGCLPLLVQIPVFFAIYKVLYVTIEMRHAPFFGWIQDLSAPDPTTLFNLFGLISFTPPSFLMIGAWPIIMAISMFLQQRMSPQPADPVQATVMKLMPLMFLFMFSSFPAGLLIYWSWNNLLSIIQQTCINKLDKEV